VEYFKNGCLRAVWLDLGLKSLFYRRFLAFGGSSYSKMAFFEAEKAVLGG